jgi:hypothetical protein
MLELGQVFDGPEGQVLEITGQAEGTLGEIHTGTLRLGPINMPLWVTPEGVLDAGYVLRVPPPPPPAPEEPTDPVPPDPVV